MQLKKYFQATTKWLLFENYRYRLAIIPIGENGCFKCKWLRIHVGFDCFFNCTVWILLLLQIFDLVNMMDYFRR